MTGGPGPVLGAGVTTLGQADSRPSPQTRRGSGGGRQTASLEHTPGAQLSREGLGLRCTAEAARPLGASAPGPPWPREAGGGAGPHQQGRPRGTVHRAASCGL